MPHLSECELRKMFEYTLFQSGLPFTPQHFEVFKQAFRANGFPLESPADQGNYRKLHLIVLRMAESAAEMQEYKIFVDEQRGLIDTLTTDYYAIPETFVVPRGRTARDSVPFQKLTKFIGGHAGKCTRDSSELVMILYTGHGNTRTGRPGLQLTASAGRYVNVDNLMQLLCQHYTCDWVLLLDCCHAGAASSDAQLPTLPQAPQHSKRSVLAAVGAPELAYNGQVNSFTLRAASQLAEHADLGMPISVQKLCEKLANDGHALGGRPVVYKLTNTPDILLKPCYAFLQSWVQANFGGPTQPISRTVSVCVRDYDLTLGRLYKKQFWQKTWPLSTTAKHIHKAYAQRRGITPDRLDLQHRDKLVDLYEQLSHFSKNGETIVFEAKLDGSKQRSPCKRQRGYGYLETMM